MLPAQPNQSLIDGLACLQALASAGQPVGSRALGRALGLEPTRVNRLLKTLAHLGIAQQTPDKRYVPGPAMHVLAAQAMFGSGLLRRALGPLEALRRFRLSVAMGVLWRDQVSYLYHAGPDTPPSDAIGRVGLFPATRSSLGMVLLSRLESEAVRQLYRGRTIAHFQSITALQAALAAVRRDGFALVHPYPDQTARSIAVAIAGEPVAVALSGEIAEQQVPGLADALRHAADQIAGLPDRIGGTAEASIQPPSGVIDVPTHVK